MAESGNRGKKGSLAIQITAEPNRATETFQINESIAFP